MQLTVLSRPMPLSAQIALVAAAYFIAGKMSLVLAIPPGYATAVWPPSGIALAAALALGPRIWPGIWLGSVLVNAAVESSLASAAIIASGGTLEALLAAMLIRRHVGDPGSFKRGEDVVKFIVLCASCAAVAASVALLVLASRHPFGWAEALRNWWTWWQGDATGMIIVAPLLLSWSARRGAPWPPPKRLEACCFGLLLVASAAALSWDGASQLAPFSLTFVTLPFIIWAAFRFTQREVASAIAVVCGVAVWMILERRELFGGTPLNELLLMLLTFICMVVTTGLVLVTVVAERAGRLDYLAYYDTLTGLPNRSLLRERLAPLLEAARRDAGKVCLAVIDIERFKTINDAFGREAADALLRQVAGRLRGEAGLLARVSGDQFAVAIPTGAAACAVDGLLPAAFGAPYALGGAELTLSARMGVAQFPDDGESADLLYMRAELALKKAKAAGERCLAYAPKMSERLAERLALENRLRRAIEREEFVLHYQPTLDLDSRRLAGLEALLRWRSPEAGLVPPLDFIPVLEETGMILEVGSWALERAVLDQRLWADAGLPVPRVAVNVSCIQLRQRDFVERVQRAIASAGPPRIDLEITESRIMEDVEATIDKLGRLRSLGIGVAIDDFGTGYSSLSYLAKLPVQTLKIDRTFIARMLDDDEAMALVQTIISLARTLKLQTVAEGVETEQQADVLEMLRCNQIQGYLIGRPQARHDVAALLRAAEGGADRDAG